MNYWLFSVMYDMFPEMWPRMVDMGIAAQHYPPDWFQEKRNLTCLSRLKRGDRIIAAFHRYRFAGFGILTSGFYRGGPPLRIEGTYDQHAFQERFNCRWSVLPLRYEPEFIDLRELKLNGMSIELVIGLSVRQIDRERYLAIKKKLVAAGAKPVNCIPSATRRIASDIGTPPDKKGLLTARIIRDTFNSNEMKKLYEGFCQVCGKKLKVEKGYYHSEVHHVRPLGAPHWGSDEEGNMVVLCPNHHALFDLGVPKFLRGGKVSLGGNKIKLLQWHEIDWENMQYHNQKIYFRGDKDY